MPQLSPLFKLREEATPALIHLLESVTLGTNGAKYRHLDTKERIHEADNPLHLIMERNNRVLGNVSFCRREKTWYVRYFAFDRVIQGTGTRKSNNKSNGLKGGLQHFFEDVIGSDSPYGEINSFYAYIDPHNEKSLWMSENFGFTTQACIATQSFSRVRLKSQTKVEKIEDWSRVETMIQSEYGHCNYYFEDHLRKGPFYILKNEKGDIIACAKATKARWAIERLPGKMGGWLPKLIPFIPFLRKIIRPKNHTFLVPEAVVVNNNDPDVLNALFGGMLLLENEHLILWWTDEITPLYQAVKDKVRWGILHRLIGVNKAHLVVKHNSRIKYDKSIPAYTCGFDFV